jgi:hypothetical protein
MDSVIIAAILLGIVQIIAAYGLSLLIRRTINEKQAQLEARAEEAIRKWVEPQGEGKPSKLAEVLDVGGAVIGAAAARSIMGALGAEKSHTARAANDLADQIQGEQNPILGLLAGGKRGKGAAIAKLAQMIGPMLAKQNGGADGASEYHGRRHNT